MKLGMQVGLGPGHIVLDGDPAHPPIFGLYLLWPNGWLGQDATWYGVKTRPRRLCVRWGPNSPVPKNPQFSAHVCCGQTAGWIKMALGIEVNLGPGYIVLDWDPALLPKKGEKRGQMPHKIWPISIVAKRLDASRCHSVWR